MRETTPLLLDWHYFWAPVLIIGTIVYLCVILIRFWRGAFRMRYRIYADDPVALTEQLRIIVPVPYATDRTDPRYIAYRGWFRPRFRDMMTRSVIGWLLVVLLALD
jgi:hypothetical protein